VTTRTSSRCWQRVFGWSGCRTSCIEEAGRRLLAPMRIRCSRRVTDVPKPPSRSPGKRSCLPLE
jgi:hypothetical protein